MTLDIKRDLTVLLNNYKLRRLVSNTILWQFFLIGTCFYYTLAMMFDSCSYFLSFWQWKTDIYFNYTYRKP